MRIFLCTLIWLCTSVNAKHLEYVNVVQLIRLPILIYDYHKSFKYESVREIGNDTTKLLANMSNYAPNGKVKLFIDDRDSGLQVGITNSQKQKRICVVFRGSEERLDWYHNVLVRKRKIGPQNIHVHRGFYRQLYENGNYERIVHVLQSEIAKHPSYDVFVLGHSLGGGLSTLFGYMFAMEAASKTINVVSFASPRVGNKSFKNAFEGLPNLHHFRFTNKRDVVPAIPMLRYHHVGAHIHMDGKWFKKGDGNTLFKSWSIRDHSIDSYYDSLKRGRGWGDLWK